MHIQTHQSTSVTSSGERSLSSSSRDAMNEQNDQARHSHRHQHQQQQEQHQHQHQHQSQFDTQWLTDDEIFQAANAAMLSYQLPFADMQQTISPSHLTSTSSLQLLHDSPTSQSSPGVPAQQHAQQQQTYLDTLPSGLPVFASTTTDSSPEKSSEEPRSEDQTATKQPRFTKKRQRIVAAGSEGDQEADLEPFSETAPAEAITMLCDAIPAGHPLRHIRGWPCGEKNCFTMTPIGQKPLNFLKQPLLYKRFAVYIKDPSQRLHEFSEASPYMRLNSSGSGYREHDTLVRTAGKSMHLVITAMPVLKHPRQLDNGFALIIACRNVRGSWQPACLASFESTSNHKARARTNEIAFKANMEHCVDEATGRRLWGQRTSHVKRKDKEISKPIRILPKGPIGINMAEEFCFFVALFTPDGHLLRHADNVPCIAQSNTVRFEPKIRSNDNMTALMREVQGLSLFERADLCTTSTMTANLRTLLVTSDAGMLARVGQKTYKVNGQPETAIELSSFLPLSEANLSEDFKRRVRAVARSIGWHHADPGLTDPTSRTLESTHSEAAEGRYFQLIVAGLDEAKQWLADEGLDGPDMHESANRAEMTGYLLHDRKFCSAWTVVINNIYPDKVLVDSKDPDKVHCLANTTFEADIGLRDRMAPLARLAYCSRLPRSDLAATILDPYVEGFLSRSPEMVDHHGGHTGDITLHYPFSGRLVSEERFYLLLHAMFLDFYLYWIRFRNSISVRRIGQRLYEDDQMFGQWYFEPGRMVKFAK